MLYLILENNVAREYSIKELKSDNPMVSFPDPIPESVLADWNVYPYTEAAIPSHDTKTQTLSHGDFSQDSNNDWVRGWNVSNLSQSEAEDRCRGERNRLLKETDYLALSDNTLSASMTTYRQALRDITDQTDDDGNSVFPFSITWPTKP